MNRFSLFFFSILFFCLLFFGGCSGVGRSLRGVGLSARSSFPLKYFYYPSYESITAIYAKNPELSIELMERLAGKHPENLSYQLTLAEMYRDRGKVNDAIRLWFRILAMSRKRGIVDGRTLPVYLIPRGPDEKEGIRPYNRMIDKSLAFENIAQIYYLGAFYEEASEYYDRAARSTRDPDRKARLLKRAGMAIGSKKVDPPSPYLVGSGLERSKKKLLLEQLKYRKKERGYYQRALSLPISDQGLLEAIQKNLLIVEEEIGKMEGPASIQPVSVDAVAGKAALLRSAAVHGTHADVGKDALLHFQLGEFEKAAELWKTLYVQFPPESYLIEVELDCEPDSLEHIYERLPEPQKFFILPKSYHGRTCYQICLGPYDSREEASLEALNLKTLRVVPDPRVKHVNFPLK